jgi:adenine-specific DNA-methyltransferase
VSRDWSATAPAVVYRGDCRDLLAQIPDESIQLVVTSPPYNIGKSYESRISLEAYVQREDEVIAACIRKLQPGGSICWQVGNHVSGGAIVPLDIALYESFRGRGLSLRNRIVWHFEHGLHCSRRFSGRYEVVLWFTKDRPDGTYHFNVDPIRVPQKYPGKRYFKGPRKGEYSANPLGKNPGDVWVIPNVKHNHPEKTDHPCQFPVELVERLVLALTREGDTVLDPYLGAGSTAVAAVLNARRGVGAEIVEAYANLATSRLGQAMDGTLRVRPRSREVYVPPASGRLVEAPWMKVHRED